VTRFERLNLSSRVFCIAGILGLSLALFDASAVRGTMLLAAISATAIATDLSSRLPRTWVALAESALAALVVGVAMPEGLVLLPYLVVPSLVVGISAGARPVLAVVAVESTALGAVVLTAGTTTTDPTELTSVVVPWLITSLGVGLLCAWLREMRIGTRGFPGDTSYESARRLLTQLRTVARRLSSGLDAVSMASQLLVTVHQHLGDTHSAVFVRTEGGVLAPMGYRGVTAKEGLLPEGAVVDRCWAEMEPAQEPQQSGLADRRNRLAIPLRAGERMIGVVLADTAQPIPAKVLHDLMPEVDDHALRLDTALAFDEVRSLATLEEGHRLARDIHDGVAQEIASLGYAVDDLAASATTDTQRKKLAALRGELSRIVSELRLSIFDLRSEISGGLGSALSDYVREVGARSGMTVHLTLDQAPTRLRSEVETELLRIAQEAITNARKHSAAKNLWVDCRIRPPYAHIVVSDDGTGLGKAREDSYGLGIMRERADRIGATLRVDDSAPRERASGTTVTVTVGGEAPAPVPAMRSEVIT
jgi:signal transduction histidine kinase